MKNIPNILSVFRILLIPFFINQVIKNNTYGASLILIASGITDILDGMIARAMNWVTPFGKILDPIADKLTQIVVYIALIIKFNQYWVIFSVMIIKDLVMLAAGGILMKKGIKIQGAKWFGKLATIMFYLTAILIFLFPELPKTVTLGLLIITFACVLLSALLYLPGFLKHRNNLNE